MGKPILYLETTIPSYSLSEPSRDLVAAGRQNITHAWWKRDHAEFDIFVSDVVLREAEKGDRQAAKKRLAFLEQFPVLEATSDIASIVELYLKKKVVPFGSAEDAAHLAFASVHRMEFLCTWNFRHLANAFALRRLREENDKNGLFTPQVCTPEELLGD